MLLLSAAFGLQAQEPFDVRAELSAGDGGFPVLSVHFSVAAKHYLYEDHIAIAPAGDFKLVPERVPPAKRTYDSFLEKEVGLYDHDVTFAFRVEGVAPSDGLDIEVRYQGCSEALCFMPARKILSVGAAVAPTSEIVPKVDVSVPPALSPEAGFSMTGRASGYLSAQDFLAFLDRAESGVGMQEQGLLRSLRGRGMWLSALLILLGGLALNLTPCVLPMIPVNIAIIGAGAGGGTRWRGFALGAAYGAGIALVYGLLGAVVVGTGAKFGTLNASPWFNLGIAVLFAVLALAMFGVFNLDFSRFQAGIRVGQSARGSFLTAFVFGGVAALLSGACVAPVVIAVLVFSAEIHAGGNVLGLLLPFLLGLGMAIPWPFAGAGLSFLPKPGRWMERVKIVFGLVILLLAAWYGRLAVSIWAQRQGSDRAATVAMQAGRLEEGWLTSIDAALEQAQREVKPIFIDFWASWCKSCLKMEKTTFEDAAVRARLAGYVRVKFQAEDQNARDVKRVLDRYGVLGLPTYVVLRPQPSGPAATRGKDGNERDSR